MVQQAELAPGAGVVGIGLQPADEAGAVFV